MALDWTLYERFLGVNGEPASSRESAIDEAVSIFMDGITDDPDYQSDAIVNGKVTPIVSSRTSTIECAIKAIPGTNLCIGDMVECYDERWIVVELYQDKIGVLNGKMWLCNNTIKFQNNSPVIYTRYCVVDDGTYSKRSSDPDAFVMTNTYKIYITIDDATERLYVDKRLSLGKIYSSSGEQILEVYKVIGIDMKSKNFGAGSHIMMLTMQRDVYNAEADNITANICDFYSDNAPATVHTNDGSCIIDGKNSVRIGTSRKYTASFIDINGDTICGVDAVWDISAPDSVKWSVDANTCILTIPLDSNLVGENIVIRVADQSEKYGVFEKKVQVITVG